MNRRSKIVTESRQRQLHSARTTAWLDLGFENLYFEPRLRQGDCGGEPVGARTHDTCFAARESRSARPCVAQAAFFLRIGFF